MAAHAVAIEKDAAITFYSLYASLKKKLHSLNSKESKWHNIIQGLLCVNYLMIHYIFGITADGYCIHRNRIKNLIHSIIVQ